MNTAPHGDPLPGSPWPAGARVVFQQDYAGTLVAAPLEFPGYVIIEWDSYDRSVVPAFMLGHRIVLEGSQCRWCWGQLGGAWFEWRGDRYCNAGCRDRLEAAKRGARERVQTDALAGLVANP